MAKKLKVLYVDDEENNLNAFKSYFRKDYQVFTAPGVEEAFKILHHSEMNIIVTDQRMPVMNGVDFLEKTVEMYPDAIRLLITGYSDIQVVIAAINKGRVNKYIEKPWDWDKLKLMLSNCADLYHSRRELKLKNLELQKANDELNRFIYSASHDLRAPLMSILGIIKLARMENNLGTEYIGLIENNILKLDEFIKNIIGYYQNSRSAELIEPIDFEKMVDAEIDMLLPSDEPVEFVKEIEQSGEFTGDYFRIRLIINNLISNAIKYRNHSGRNHVVTVRISVNDVRARIIISDNGLGISEEHLENIFKMFYRAHPTSSRYGSGIGLFVVQESLEKIGGTIDVRSTPGQGSEFEVNIPNNI